MRNVDNIKRILNSRQREEVIDWTKSISAGDEQFIKMMFSEMFPQLLEMSNEELIKWCRERNIFYEMDFYSYIAEINKESNTGQFDWLTK